MATRFENEKNAKKHSWIFLLVMHKKPSLVTLSLCPRCITAGCVIVFEMFRRNSDGTFYVAVKIGGDSKKMLGLGAFHLTRPLVYGLGSILLIL
jgi:hypothetical protein